MKRKGTKMKGNETKIRKLIEVLTKLLSNRMKMKMKMIDFELFINRKELEWNVFVYHNDLIQKIPVFFYCYFLITPFSLFYNFKDFKNI